MNSKQRSLGESLDSFSKNQQVASGVNTSKAFDGDNTFSVGYFMPTPRSGIIASVFPSDANWHPLYNHNYSEITENLVAIESSNIDDDTKKHLKKQVGETVKMSYTVRAKSKFIVASVLFIVILLVVLAYSITTGNWGNTAALVALGVGSLMLITSGIMVFLAKNKGSSYWSTYTADLNGKMGTGRMLHDILAIYEASEEREKDRDVMKVAKRKNSSTTSSGLLGGLIGGILASNIRT
jgi:hypothetical protein